MKVMIHDGIHYIDAEEIAVIFPNDAYTTVHRSVRLKSGHVHNSPGTAEDLYDLMMDTYAKADGVLVADWPGTFTRFPDPGRKIDD